MRGVTEMARFAVAHFRKQISAVDIASAANLNPNYATSLFRRAGVGALLGGTMAVSEGSFRLTVTGPAMVNGDLVAVPVGSPAGARAQRWR